MRRAFPFLAFAVLVGCGVVAPQPEPAPDPGPPPVEWSPDLQTIADASNHFAIDLYGKLREEEKGNIFFSPYSIHTALGMTATGAKDQTRDEMINVLHLPADEAKMLASGDLGRFYAHPRRDFELSVANALWGQKGFPWRPEWLAMQNDRFGAGFHEVDFEKDKTGAIGEINGWVSDRTRGKINGLLKPKDVPVYERAQITRLILTNAIYFKGEWTEAFKKELTKDEPFHMASEEAVSVPMMHHTTGYRYGETEGLQILEVLYRGDELSMLIVLPRKPDGIHAVETRLPEEFAGWLGKLGRTEVNVTLPRFRIEERFEPNEPLQQLGMATAFDGEKADFSGMTPAERLFISKVIHQAFVDVNEEGTEAAAATAVVMAAQLGAAKSPPVVFRADHPFLFLIRDTKHGTILFLGRVMNPKE